MDYAEKIKELEEELRKTPYNKATQHHIGLVKAKIAKLREKALARGSGGGKGQSYAVRKSGDASCVLVGFPSVGKSTLLNALTNAESETAAYAFTTLDVIPGLMEYENAQIQILDVPGILEGAAIGKGRGREVLSVVRSADLVIFLADATAPSTVEVLRKEINDSGLRVNEERPDVKITKKARGGINLGTTVRLSKMSIPTIISILREFRINNADVVLRTDVSPDQLIDAIEGNRLYVPGITVLTKSDLVSDLEVRAASKKVKADIAISASAGKNIDKLQKLIYKKLGLIRIYCKEVSKEADLKEPLILNKDASVRDACLKLHKDFVSGFRFVRIWGSSAKFPGQRLSLKHRLKDKDIIEIHVR